MVARANKNRPESPNLSIRVELDNRALKVKNNSLTQTVAKLQRENAELSKEVTLLRGECFEINSKYNNLKNVISIIDSTTKTCLPKFNEMVETFTGIIQLCSVAANIGSFYTFNDSTKKEARTQAVKPQIVNGHILHNPTITLSRLSSDNSPNTSRSSNNIPSTSQGLDELTIDRNRLSNRTQEENDNSDDRDNEDDNEEEDYFLQGSSRVSRRMQSVDNMDGTRRNTEDFEDSDDEENEGEEDSDEDSEHRLTTIHEAREENELIDAISPRSRQMPFLQGRLQEVRISLNQLPNAYIEQFLSSGNISISVSPPDRRASFKHASDMVDDRRRRYVENQPQEEPSFSDDSRLNQVSVSFKTPGMRRSRESFEGSGSRTSSMMAEYSDRISAISGLQTPSTIIQSDSNSLHSDTLQELDTLHIELHKTSTPIVPRISSGGMAEQSVSQYDTPDRSKNGSMFKSNVTKRKTASKEKKKVAQVLLNRLSVEKRLSSGSPIKNIESIVNLPVIRKSSEFEKRKKTKANDINITCSNEENVEKEGKNNEKTKRRKKDPPTKKNEVLKSKLKTSPTKSPGRPKRTARPKTLKEPNLVKKMRRSK